MPRTATKPSLHAPVVEVPFCAVIPPHPHPEDSAGSYRMVASRSPSKPPSNPGSAHPPTVPPRSHREDPGVYIHVSGTDSAPPVDEPVRSPSSRPASSVSGLRRARSA